MTFAYIFQLIIEIVPIVISAASAIAAVTKTPRDDKLIGKLYRFLVDIPALNIGRAKEL